MFWIWSDLGFLKSFRQFWSGILIKISSWNLLTEEDWDNLPETRWQKIEITSRFFQVNYLRLFWPPEAKSDLAIIFLMANLGSLLSFRSLGGWYHLFITFVEKITQKKKPMVYRPAPAGKNAPCSSLFDLYPPAASRVFRSRCSIVYKSAQFKLYAMAGETWVSLRSPSLRRWTHSPFISRPWRHFYPLFKFATSSFVVEVENDCFLFCFTDRIIWWMVVGLLGPDPMGASPEDNPFSPTWTSLST